MKKFSIYRYLVGLVIFWACGTAESPVPENTLFEKLPASLTGVDFRNDLSFDDQFNIFTYRNYYNGGGVAVGDVNGDGLMDIYLTANMGPNKLYLNQGDFKFVDVTAQAGVAGTRAWSTGVAIADVNGDGLLDIYVCNSGDVKGDNKQNELFINNGDGTFTEMAEAFGLADEGFSTHAVFFDYDNDGDLDLYLLNNSYQAIGSFNKMQNERPRRDPVGGDKLFRNEGGKFTDVSEEAGIYGSVIGFGLGITIGDVNRDGWMDIFISNDFFERDYLYINNQDGTFTESLTDYMISTSAASMGADIADLTNDGYLDIFVTEMLPEPPQRLKQITTFESWDKFQFNVEHGYHYQYTRNMLHVNNGDGTYSDLGRMTNVEATDWSWAALMFDMDNDGLKDIWVANGIYQDLTDLDYLNFIDNEDTKRAIISKEGVDYKALIDPMPINPVSNYAFKNKGNLVFENVVHQWGLGDPIHSNGSAYVDLNNDGALDLVVNNVNREVLIFKNKSREMHPEHNFLKIELKGKGQNTNAIGAQVRLIANGQSFYQEQMPNRGFQSSVDPRLNFGLGSLSSIDEVQVRWPDGAFTRVSNVEVNQTLVLSWTDAVAENFQFFTGPQEQLFKKVVKTPVDFTHQENRFVDFDRDRLTYHKLSTEGPAVAVGDVNGDGLEDIFFGGARSFEASLYLQQRDGTFKKSNQSAFAEDKLSEDVDAVFADFNGDGMLDLLVASGGNESGFGSMELADRLYLNDGKGNFTKSTVSGLVNFKNSTSSLQVMDINGDGHLDILAFSRVVPFLYGVNPNSLVLLNDGKGAFTDATATIAPEFKELGMVTDAVLADLDGDGRLDVAVVGEWMAPTIFWNRNGKLAKDIDSELSKFTGWYQAIAAGDLTGDGKVDLVLGNHGLNTRFKTSFERPIRMFVNDFDQNGSVEHVFVQKSGDKHVPFTLKHELERQIPSIKKNFLKYSSFNDKFLEEIFTPQQLEKAIIQEVNFFQSAVLLNQGSGSFEVKELPRMAQRSWMYSIAIEDVDGDGNLDILMGGNLYGAKPEVGQYDASYGELLLGNGDGTFEYVPNRSHGLQIKGEVRDLRVMQLQGKRQLMVTRNTDRVEFWEF
jgi:enediyne biosynthesis protein E4